MQTDGTSTGFVPQKPFDFECLILSFPLNQWTWVYRLIGTLNLHVLSQNLHKICPDGLSLDLTLKGNVTIPSLCMMMGKNICMPEELATV